MIFYFILIFLIIFIDQWSKKRAFLYMKSKSSPVKFRFITIETARNEGAALGFLRKRKELLITLIMLMMILLGYIFVISLREGYPIVTKFGISMVFGGAVGNLIDRVRFKYVRDFFAFNFKKSPVFNIADMFIFIGVIIAVSF